MELIKKKSLIITPDEFRNEYSLKVLLKANLLNQTEKSLYSILISCFEKSAFSKEYNYLKEVLHDLKAIPVFYDKQKNQLRYFYGSCYTNVGHNRIIFGTDQLPKVSFLFHAILSLMRFCRKDFESILKRLFSDPRKHWDNLCELDPLIRVSNNPNIKSIDHEVKIAVDSNKRVDWLIELNDRKYAIEVKSRQKSLIEYLPFMLEANANGVFSDCDEKFNEDNSLIKVIWVITAISYQAKALLEKFNEQNKNKINVAVITNLICPATIIGHSDSQCESIKTDFQLREMERTITSQKTL